MLLLELLIAFQTQAHAQSVPTPDKVVQGTVVGLIPPYTKQYGMNLEVLGEPARELYNFLDVPETTQKDIQGVPYTDKLTSQWECVHKGSDYDCSIRVNADGAVDRTNGVTQL